MPSDPAPTPRSLPSRRRVLARPCAIAWTLTTVAILAAWAHTFAGVQAPTFAAFRCDVETFASGGTLFVDVTPRPPATSNWVHFSSVYVSTSTDPPPLIPPARVSVQ